jgi:hypothetical protein
MIAITIAIHVNIIYVILVTIMRLKFYSMIRDFFPYLTARQEQSPVGPVATNQLPVNHHAAHFKWGKKQFL